MIFRFMANRLAPLLNRMVSQNQSAFIRGRCIHDNFILVQQTLRLLHRQGDPRILLKLDISKAFDSSLGLFSWRFSLTWALGSSSAIWFAIYSLQPLRESC